MIIKKENWFEAKILEELDLIWETYKLDKGKQNKNWVFCKRKRLSCYDYDRLVERTKELSSPNPVMDIIFDTIWMDREQCFPIYKREKWHRALKWEALLWEPFYDVRHRCRLYWDNWVDHTIDYIYSGYPPIVTRMFCNDMKNGDWENLLVYYIKKRYANKKTSQMRGS